MQETLLSPTENISQQPEAQLSREVVDSWMKNVDQLIDQDPNKKYTLGNGEYSLLDGVNKHDRDNDGNLTGTTTPVVILENNEGEIIELPTIEFLGHQGFSEVKALESKENIKTESDESDVGTYDDLFAADEDDYIKGRSVEAAREVTLEVKKEDVNISESGLIEVINKDSNFKNLLSTITDNFESSNQDDLLKKLREDESSSSKIRQYIEIKLEQNMAKMPPRIFENSTSNFKNPNYPGYEKMNKLTSKEYVLILAEVMLNGKFNFDSSKSSPVVINRSGEVEVGQHRAAALYSLGFSLDDPWVQENFKIEQSNR